MSCRVAAPRNKCGPRPAGRRLVGRVTSRHASGPMRRSAERGQYTLKWRGQDSVEMSARVSCRREINQITCTAVHRAIKMVEMRSCTIHEATMIHTAAADYSCVRRRSTAIILHSISHLLASNESGADHPRPLSPWTRSNKTRRSRRHTRRSTCLQMPKRISSSQSSGSAIGADWLPVGSTSWANHPIKRHQRQSRTVSRTGTSVWLYEGSDWVVCTSLAHFVAGSCPQPFARSWSGMNCGEAFSVLSSRWRRRELSPPFEERARCRAARPAGDRVEHLTGVCVTMGEHTRVVVTDMGV